jgi:steroid delta-isomerase-like uncharacterized protein
MGRGVMGAGKDLWTEVKARYNKGDLVGMASLYISDAVLTDPNGRFEGIDAMMAYLRAVKRAFPDEVIETSRLIEEGDTTVAEWTWRATHSGPFVIPDGNEIPATGKTVDVPGVSVVRVRDGKIASDCDYLDNAAVMSQLGLMPGT